MEGTDVGQSRFGHPDLTNLGQSIFGQSISGSGVCHGPKGWAQTQKKSGPQGGAPKGGAPKGGLPKISRFFSLSRHKIRSFLPSLEVYSWNFGGVWKRPSAQMCTFRVLGLSWETPAVPKPPGFLSHHSPREPKCAHFRVPGLQKNHQNSTRKHTVRDKKSEIGGGRR